MVSPEHQNENNLSEKLTKEVFELITGSNGAEIYGKIGEFCKKIRGEFPDYIDYLYYHILIGSTPDRENPPSKLDFPEPYSVMSLTEKLMKEYNIEL